MPLVQRVRWLALALVAFAQPLLAATPPAAPAPDAAAAVRLLAPADGAVLAGGSSASFAWEPGTDMDLAGAHEWEAFLSLDGGGTWPIRITPHLDIALRRVSFPVPALPSADVRFLLRVGDEDDEVAYSVPGGFSIAGDPGDLLPSAVLRYGAGETALAGDEGVVGWVEGSPRGTELRNVVAMPLARGMHGVQPPRPDGPALQAETETGAPRVPAPGRGPAVDAVPAYRVATTRPRPSPPGSRDILLMIERLDE